MSRPPVSFDRLPSSPVRGQLDPYDRKTEKGWRYIQLTDTHDELKVCPFIVKHLMFLIDLLGAAASWYSSDVRTTVKV